VKFNSHLMVSNCLIMFHRFEWMPPAHGKPHEIKAAEPALRHKKEDRPMSKDTPEKTTETSTGENNQGGGMKALILAALLVGIMAALAGWFLGKQIGEEVTSADLKQNQAAKHADTDKKSDNDSNNELVPLMPIVTNLLAPETAWIRMEISLLVKEGQVIEPEQQAEISNDFIALLRQMTLAQVKGPTGLMNLREDLLERARIRSEGRVSALLISNLVIE